MIGYSKICLDDTARKHLEDALTPSNADLQQFAFIASHDLQERLRTIISFGQLLQRWHEGALDDNGKELFRTFLGAGRCMNVLIQDLFSRSGSEPSHCKRDSYVMYVHVLRTDLLLKATGVMRQAGSPTSRATRWCGLRFQEGGY